MDFSAKRKQAQRVIAMKNKTIAYGFMMLLLLLMTSGYATADGPWKGKILDVETKEPLEGVVVLAVWQRVYRTPFGSNAYLYEAKETVTNKIGEFEIPSYAPINLLPVISYMRGPLFTIFKPGYGNVNGVNIGGYFTGKPPEEQYAIFDGRKYKLEEQDFKLEGKRYRYASGVIELPKLKTRKERLKHLPSSSDPFLDHYDKKKEYMRLLGVESRDLGLQPESEPIKYYGR
jgi:hypothetical protein